MAVLAQPQLSDALSFFAGRFGIDAPLCQEVLHLALARGGDHADFYVQHAQNRALSLEDGVVRGGTSIDAGVGVRVIQGEAVGYAATERLDRDALLAAARKASEIASGGGLPSAP